MSGSNYDERARVEFFRLGVDYYVAGRFAAFSRLFPVAANLLHHAIEMFLKGALVCSVDLDALKGIGHDLRALWSEFKKHHPSSTESDSFDEAIGELHRFERLRYPDVATVEGMELTFDVFRENRVEASSPGKSLSRYSLVLQDVDALVKFMFQNQGVNPRFYLQRISAEALGVLNRDNVHPLE
jgi:hypothetical protein